MSKQKGQTISPSFIDTEMYQAFRSVPYGRTLGIEFLGYLGKTAVTRISVNPRIAISETDSRIHPLAVVAQIDHSAGYALMNEPGFRGGGIATLDLRYDFPSNQSYEGDILVESEPVMLDGHSAVLQNSAHDASGNVVMTCNGLFRVGAAPGGAVEGLPNQSDYNPDACEGPFIKTLGLKGEPGELYLDANNLAIAGWEASRAYHGGAIANLLILACQDRAKTEGEIKAGKRLASVHLRFIRPGNYTQALLSRSDIERKGRAASYITASCYHADGRLVASAHATYVAR